MRRKILTVLFAAVFFVSCQNQYEKNLANMGSQFKKFIDDMAFKDNGSVEYLAFEPIGYDTVTMAEYYNGLYNLYIAESDRHFQLLKANELKINRVVNDAKLYGLLGDRSGVEDAREELNNLAEITRREAKVIRVIAKKLDSIANLIEKENLETMYMMHVYIKAIYTYRNGETDNKMDTIPVLFNTDFKMVQFPDVAINIDE